jgi:hypothetical protein
VEAWLELAEVSDPAFLARHRNATSRASVAPPSDDPEGWLGAVMALYEPAAAAPRNGVVPASAEAHGGSVGRGLRLRGPLSRRGGRGAANVRRRTPAARFRRSEPSLWGAKRFGIGVHPLVIWITFRA